MIASRNLVTALNAVVCIVFYPFMLMLLYIAFGTWNVASRTNKIRSHIGPHAVLLILHCVIYVLMLKIMALLSSSFWWELPVLFYTDKLDACVSMARTSIEPLTVPLICITCIQPFCCFVIYSVC